MLSAAYNVPTPEPGPRLFYWGAYTADEDYPDVKADLSNITRVNLKDATHFTASDVFPQNGETVTFPYESKMVIFAAPAGIWNKAIKMTDTILHGQLNFDNDNRRVENRLSVLDSNTGEQVPYDFWYYKPSGAGLVGDPNDYEINWIAE